MHQFLIMCVKIHKKYAKINISRVLENNSNLKGHYIYAHIKINLRGRSLTWS